MRHPFERLARRFFSNAAESDVGFSAEIRRTALLSLRAVGALEIAVPLLMAAARLSVVPVAITTFTRAIPNLLFAVLGALTLGAAWTVLGRLHARLVLAASVFLSVAIMIWSAILVAPRLEWVEHHIIGYIVLVMFGCASAVPLKPLQTLMLGFSIDALYLGSVLIASGRPELSQGAGGFAQHVFTLVVTLLCAALTASIYEQRYNAYLVHQKALHTSERLREAEKKLLLSENAATMGRVAAALSHELNSPIGVLSSCVASLAHLARRISDASPSERDRLRMVLDDLHRSGQQSAERLREIVSRIQRFTNLDRAEVQSVNLNDLILDVVALVRAEHPDRESITTELVAIPPVVCRPQQVGAVISNLVSNAVRAAGGTGRVVVATRPVGDDVEIRVEDDGSGIAAADLPALFDPAAFRTSQGRVSAANWSLFSCHQIVREHGGSIEVSSEVNRGTRVRVLLPAGQPDVSAAHQRVSRFMR
jgi:signal transduction histidine kinase